MTAETKTIIIRLAYFALIIAVFAMPNKDSKIDERYRFFAMRNLEENIMLKDQHDFKILKLEEDKVDNYPKDAIGYRFTYSAIGKDGIKHVFSGVAMEVFFNENHNPKAVQ